jgi:hypothetical protein
MLRSLKEMRQSYSRGPSCIRLTPTFASCKVVSNPAVSERPFILMGRKSDPTRSRGSKARGGPRAESHNNRGGFRSHYRGLDYNDYNEERPHSVVDEARDAFEQTDGASSPGD